MTVLLLTALAVAGTLGLVYNEVKTWRVLLRCPRDPARIERGVATMCSAFAFGILLSPAALHLAVVSVPAWGWALAGFLADVCLQMAFVAQFGVQRAPAKTESVA